MKSTIIVADTSPLIALAVTDLLPILNDLFDTVYVPSAVVNECLYDIAKPKSKEIKRALKDKILIQRSVSDPAFSQLLAKILDLGEAEAIALANELDAVALIDERAGRSVATREGIRCIGSLYCLIRAKEKALIDSVAPRLQRLVSHGYFIEDSLIQTVLTRCEETFEQ